MKTRFFFLLALLFFAPSLRAADGSLQFSPASQQRVEVPNFDGLGIANEVTVEFWAFSTSSSIAQSVFMLNPDVPVNRFQSHVNYFNGNTYWDFGDIGSGGRVELANNPAWLNNWTHFALVGSQSGGFMKIYANGAQVASVNTFNALESVGTAILSIGGKSGTYFQGKIDDFRVWDIARAQADIQRDLGGPLTGSEPGLKLYFKFDEGIGTTAVNSATATGAAYNGTLMGTTPPTWTTPARTTYTVANANDSGTGSLRQAITDAAAASGPALITFAPALSGGSITLTGPDQGTAIAIADTGGVTIDATSLPGGLTIQRDSGSIDVFRLFSVASGSSLTLRGLTLANGGGISFFANGGAINNDGTLTLTHCTLSGNSADFGGAIDNSGTLTLTHCTLSGNSAAANGGAISNNNGTLTLTHCTLSGNSALNGGGAIYHNGTLTLTHCTLSGNSAFDGGAIFNSGTLTLTHCTLSGNSTNGGAGGAIRGSGTLTHCTLTENTANGSGGAINVIGTVTLRHCTVAGNSAGGSGSGGGAYVSDGPVLVLENSIVAGNTLTGGGTGPDIHNGGTVTATGANLVQAAIAGTGTVNGSGTITTAAPLLAPLGNYGGPTQTMALLPGSPALDAATVISGLDTDQRGFARNRDGDATAGAAPDIGAYEAQVAPVGSLGFNFNAASPRNLAATESAGAPGYAQTHWNNLTGDFAYLNGTRNLSGGGTATLRTWYDATGVFQRSDSITTPDQKLMFGYLNSNGTANSGDNLYNGQNQPFFALADLPPAFTLGGYRVVVYADTDTTSPDRIGEYWLTTVSADPSNVAGTTDLTPHLFLKDSANFSGTYTRVPATSTAHAGAEAGNYLVFENQMQPGFILRTEDHFSGSGSRAPINAVQLVRNEIIVVTTTADELDPVGTLGTGVSLREAVALAPDGAGIVFDSALSGQTITLGSEILLTEKNVTIDASSLPGGLTISGGGAHRLFYTDKVVTLKALTLTGGNGTGLYSSAGGAINNNGGTLTLTHCTLSGNSATNTGGAIRNNGGTLTLTHCTLSGNSAASDGGAIYNIGTLTLTHCTLSSNSATRDGGAIYNTIGTLTLTHCTLSGNSADDDGGAIYNLSTLTLTNSIAAGNTATTNPNISDSFTENGVNLTSGDPLLAPLGNYGGPTQTMPPLPGSPAIDAAVGSLATTDQRGAPLRDGDGNGTALADIGAVEFQRVIVTTAADENDTPAGALLSLREALRDDASGSTPAELIAFAPGFTGPIVLGSEIVIANSVAIDASSIAGGVTIDGGAGTNRIFTVNNGTTVALQNLALTGGNGSGGGGGAILNNGTLSLAQCRLSGNSGIFAGAIENNATLTLMDCALTANSATPFGGGAIDNSSSLTLLRCTFSGNTGNTFGGAIHNNTVGSILSLTQCTFSGNNANNSGGAIFQNAGTATLTHCTLSGNTGSSGGGGGAIRQDSGTLTLTNSIVAANTAGTNADIRRTVGTINATGVNLIGTLAGSTLSAGPTVIVAPPLLAPLGNYGGPTQTMALLPTSPARNAATGSTATSDQRGFPIIGTADIGAYEAGNHLATIYNVWIYETLPATATAPQHAATFDYDGDGQTNEAEWLALTSAADSNSRFTMSISAISGSNLPYSFQTAVGRNYPLEYSTDLITWNNFGTVTGNGLVHSNSIGPVTGYPKLFLRVRAVLP